MERPFSSNPKNGCALAPIFALAKFPAYAKGFAKGKIANVFSIVFPKSLPRVPFCN